MLVGIVFEILLRADNWCWSRRVNWVSASLRLAVYKECSQRRAVEFAVVLKAVLPIYLLVGVGMALRGFKVLTEDMEKGLLKMVIHCLYPCLILDRPWGMTWCVRVRSWPGVLGWGVAWY